MRVSRCIKLLEFLWVWDRNELIEDTRLAMNGVSVCVSVVEGDKRDMVLDKISPVKIDTPAGNEATGSSNAPPD